MANQELAVVPQQGLGITDVQRVGNILAASGYFSDARDMAQAAVKVMAGQELGIPPVAAMMGINIIKGKVALGGNLIASRIRAHGYDYRHKQFDNKSCVLVFFSKPDKDGKREVLGESSFTEEDAKIAGLLSNDNYKRWPRNMYFNRAMSNGAKWYTPDVFGGIPPYTPEELGASVDSEGDMIRESRIEQSPAPIAIEQPKPAAADPPKLAGLLSRMTGKYETLDVFGDLKEEFKSYLGDEAGEKLYYVILRKHDVEKSDQFKSTKPAKACVRAMYEELERICEARSYEATDDDVNLGQQELINAN